MSEPLLTYSKKDHTGIITLNRPGVHNALNKDMMRLLKQTVDKIYQDPDIVVVIITAVGDTTFCAGGDLKYFSTLKTSAEAYEMSRFMQEVLNRLWLGDRLVIGAINGQAFGGGCEILTACHFLYSVPDATFSFRQAANGIITGWGGTTRLIRKLGRGKALKLLLTATEFTTVEAQQMGFIDQVVPRDELMPSVLKFAREITAKSPAVIKAFLELTSMDNQQSLSDQFEKESQLFSQFWVARDFQDWLRKFLGKAGE
jgi:enoyl-CoA hydratase/carnithine racemase